jgi:GLTT repeat (6 copies)
MSRSLDSAALRALLAFAFVLAGCQPVEPPREVGLSASALTSGNGIATNGIATNGIATNGIATNGIATNGIATNGIATNGLVPGNVGSNGLALNGLAAAGLDAPEFAAWFATDPVYADMVMKYLARCALSADASLTYASADTTYVWPGTLGLAPIWSSGQAIPEAEQQLVTACLAAHTNGLGRHVSISVRGYGEDGAPVAVTADELASYVFSEACYFGNLFTDEGAYVALGEGSLDPSVTTPRGCAAEAGAPGSCLPMLHAGLCSDVCQPGPDGTTVSDCTLNGSHYMGLQVFLLDEDVYRCGDGVCQFTESPESCPADCQ